MTTRLTFTVTPTSIWEAEDGIHLCKLVDNDEFRIVIRLYTAEERAQMARLLGSTMTLTIQGEP